MKDLLENNLSKELGEDCKISEELTKNILNEINAYIFIFDVENLKPLWINNYFKQRMGYSNEELLRASKEDFLKLFHPKSLPIFMNRIKDFMTHGNKELKTIYQIRTKDQNWTYMLTSSRIFKRNEDGSVKYLIGYASEVNSSELRHHLNKMTGLKRKCDNLTLIASLGRREIDIIRLISRGLTDKEISDKLSISIHTTKTHRKKIIQKLEVKNTAALVKFGVDNGLC